jgi:hypothetical protein
MHTKLKSVRRADSKRLRLQYRRNPRRWQPTKRVEKNHRRDKVKKTFRERLGQEPFLEIFDEEGNMVAFFETREVYEWWCEKCRQEYLCE